MEGPKNQQKWDVCVCVCVGVLLLFCFSVQIIQYYLKIQREGMSAQTKRVRFFVFRFKTRQDT